MPGQPTPEHVAIIMDGNGRWASERGLPRLKGHEAGAESVRAALQACQDWGVRYLTVYAFSVENWVRPKAEIAGLMKLLRHFLKKEEKTLHEKKIRLRVAGRMADLPDTVRNELERIMADTAAYTEHQFILALSYGGRSEIADATRRIAKKVASGELKAESIDEDVFAAHLYLPDVPDPDFMIRTSGEQRLSNFLLWQLSYAEFYFTEVKWPDFREEHFGEAMREYGRRKRRFGDIS